MHKKDYELIASAFKDTRPVRPFVRSALPEWYSIELSTRSYLATVLAARLKQQNSAFDSDQFLIACGVKEKDTK